MTELRDKDLAILHQIQEGHTDVQQITEATTLSNREVNYCFEKLQQQGLIEVEKPGGMVERIINGQRRVFEHPKQARLTDKATSHLASGPPQKYDDMTHEELVERVHELEEEVDGLRQSLETFREQVQERL